MTDIDTVFDHAGEDLLSTMGGIEGTYTPSGEDPLPVSAFVDKGVQAQPGPYDAQAWQQGITIEAMLKDLGREPDRDDTFTLGGTTYTVLAVIENDGRYVRVSVRQEV
ncbi:MAG: hypothetical protein PVG49_09300 [Desulfobacteraceae bacterium]|jgi:hypothetical protein